MAVTVYTEAHDGADYDIGGEDRSSTLRWMGTITGPTLYAAGGEVHPSLPAGYTLVHVQSASGKGHSCRKGSNNKIEIFVDATGVEAGAVDLTTMVMPVVVYYRKP